MRTIARLVDVDYHKIKLAAVLAFLTTLADAPKAAKADDFECPRADIAATKCMGSKDCLYENTRNCNTFLQCVPQPDGSGKPVVLPCAPGGLEWNDKKKECDWPHRSTCGQAIHKQVPVPAHLKDACNTQKIGVYADPKRCECFYVCDEGIHYQCCNPGLRYQVKGHMCAAPSEVQCGNRTPPAK